MTESRLVDIETKLAYQEDALDELSKTLRAQEKRIEQLEAVCKLLIERMSDMASAAGDSPSGEFERPPHY